MPEKKGIEVETIPDIEDEINKDYWEESETEG